MLGKVIRVHQDPTQVATLMYRPEVTDELTLSVVWLRTGAVITLSQEEMEALAKKLTKGVKKMRKHRAKLAKQHLIKTDPVPEYIKHGRRR